MATAYAPKTISPKQSAFIASLMEMREVPAGLAAKFTENMTSFQASQLIDDLKNCPWKSTSTKKTVKAEPVSEGFYFITEGLMDVVYCKVQTSKTTGKRYALRWNGKKWEYAAGLVYTLTAEDKLTAEQAQQFGKKTGKCLICGRLLTVKESVEAGVGPVCSAKMGW